jgi:NADH dehydrogenase
VVGIDRTGVRLEAADGKQSHIESRTVLWGAGVQASPIAHLLATRTGVPLDKAGRVHVRPDLTVPGHPEIFVIGDLVHLEQDGKLVPGVAPAAIQMGTYVARTIRRRLKGEPVTPFRYFNKGSLATIGRNSAVAEVGPLKFSGYFAWLTWLFVHLLYIVEFENRLLIVVQWAYDYFTHNRGARLITGVWASSDEALGPKSLREEAPVSKA